MTSQFQIATLDRDPLSADVAIGCVCSVGNLTPFLAGGDENTNAVDNHRVGLRRAASPENSWTAASPCLATHAGAVQFAAGEPQTVVEVVRFLTNSGSAFVAAVVQALEESARLGAPSDGTVPLFAASRLVDPAQGKLQRCQRLNACLPAPLSSADQQAAENELLPASLDDIERHNPMHETFKLAMEAQRSSTEELALWLHADRAPDGGHVRQWNAPLATAEVAAVAEDGERSGGGKKRQSTLPATTRLRTRAPACGLPADLFLIWLGT